MNIFNDIEYFSNILKIVFNFVMVFLLNMKFLYVISWVWFVKKLNVYNIF